jgi:hypothetical protein
MQIGRYSEGLPGLILGDAIYPLAEALTTRKATRAGALMADVIDALASIRPCRMRLPARLRVQLRDVLGQ